MIAADTFEAEGTLVRVLGNNLLVRVLPQVRASRGGILIPANVMESALAVGEVLAVGYVTTTKLEQKIPIPGVAKGDFVVFVRFHERLDSNQHVSQVCGASVIRIRPGDVLLVIDECDVERLQ